MKKCSLIVNMPISSFISISYDSRFFNHENIRGKTKKEIIMIHDREKKNYFTGPIMT